MVIVLIPPLAFGGNSLLKELKALMKIFSKLKTAESGGTYHDEIHIAEACCRDGPSNGAKVKDYNLDDLNWSETRQAFIDDDTPKMLLDELNRFEEDFGIYLYKAVELANENDDKYNSHAEHLYRCIGEYDCLVPIARQKEFGSVIQLYDAVARFGGR